MKTLQFQVGDRVTRGLLAVSQLCCNGAGVWFGPGPEFKSCIVWDKNAFIAAEGPKSDIFVRSGTYMLPIREIYRDKPGVLAAAGDKPEVAMEAENMGTSVGSGAGAQGNPIHSQGLGDRDVVDNRNLEQAIIETQSENPPVKVIRAPEQPSSAEVEAHSAAGHWPFRSWCPTCVAGAAPDDPHRTIDKPTHDFPVFSSDYAFMGSKNDQEKITLYVVKESKTKSIFSTVVPRKGVSETDVAINFMLECVAELGFAHHTIYLKSD